ncbi:MAG: hypothetical protein GY934_19390 [Gammaproteobacteria bacterium]|nr:hypothetical protein [Gammaproteobacteria bacterium]
MKQQEPASLNLKHSLGVSVSLVLGGILIWVIQLARGGEPIGYVILTGLGVILVLPVVGLVLYLLIGAIGKLQRGQSTDDVKTIYETQRVLRAQNQELARLLLQMQNNPGLHNSDSGQDSPNSPTLLPLLSPGQVITPEGFVIDGAAFDTLTDEEKN